MDSQQDTAVFAPSGEPDEAAVLAYLKAHPDFSSAMPRRSLT